MAGKYDKLGVIGCGNYGEARLVRSKFSKQKFVIKSISLQNLTDKELDQAMTEVSVLARCHHHNIIKYVEGFVEEGALGIVMEFANNGDLHNRILKQKGIHFTKEVVLNWFVQICLALQYIHRLGILHRDLKTQNIFLTSDDTIKLGDFGIARTLKDSSDHALTLIGTPFYLSPEICQRQPYNHKSDMWAAGCVLYELCSLHVPFDAPDFTSLVLKILQAEYTPIPRHFGEVLKKLVCRLLDTNVSRRFSADQVLLQSDLQSYVRKHTDILMTFIQKLSVCDATVEALGRGTNYGVNDGLKELTNKEMKQERKMSSKDSNNLSDIRRSCQPEDKENMSPELRLRSTYLVSTPRLQKLSTATARINSLAEKQKAALSAERNRKMSKDGELRSKNCPKMTLVKELTRKRAMTWDAAESKKIGQIRSSEQGGNLSTCTNDSVFTADSPADKCQPMTVDSRSSQATDRSPNLIEPDSCEDGTPDKSEPKQDNSLTYILRDDTKVFKFFKDLSDGKERNKMSTFSEKFGELLHLAILVAKDQAVPCARIWRNNLDSLLGTDKLEHLLSVVATALEGTVPFSKLKTDLGEDAIYLPFLYIMIDDISS